ncbi:hypothetical protein [Mesorhizobium sp.]|uniref:hypothetical protein n=1 Tax=Mesorhizobium sp. TaxID=1871066 RepID=UPI000FE603B8|nr:hypothetical protein [Mesorhizobium sp.]RWM09033.1 MAG: hypothetical protein EOR71_11010 [Mesorhizobium sp.]TIO51525.1 MAG: hypothetical protein E5X78_17190 [Mesorhizobium sp.]TIO59588.1 MAG: hypothetical protein E5X79_15615 [Mesorhizobium sp.]TJV64972.1 MAG: hypothetical protein E5X80_13500 [Mesorhizobium sp.]
MKRLALLLAAVTLAAFLAQAAHAAGRPITIIDDPQVLAALDARGFAFAGIFDVGDKGDLKTLYDTASAYHAIVETVAADVAALRAEMKAGGSTK